MSTCRSCTEGLDTRQEGTHIHLQVLYYYSTCQTRHNCPEIATPLPVQVQGKQLRQARQASVSTMTGKSTVVFLSNLPFEVTANLVVDVFEDEDIEVVSGCPRACEQPRLP